ncbi:MAG: class E sortase, partial [Actinomycetes bacterium]
MTDDDRWPEYLASSEDVAAGRATAGRSTSAVPPRSNHRRRPRVLARVTHAFGELLLTVGALLLLFVAYTLWWTGVETGNQQAALKDELANQWEQQPLQPGQPGATGAPGAPSTPGAPEEPPGLADVEIGDGVAILRIPRFGPSYAWAVVEGIDEDNLTRGPGHYPETALPGEVGNFAVAGHRATHGEPFAQFEELETGDPVVVETATQWYTYEIVDDGIRYPVPISSGWALDPNPLDLGNPP